MKHDERKIKNTVSRYRKEHNKKETPANYTHSKDHTLTSIYFSFVEIIFYYKHSNQTQQKNARIRRQTHSN